MSTLMVLICVFLTFAWVIPVQETAFTRVRITPRDEACTRRDLCEFVQRLRVLIDQRDTGGVMALVSSVFNEDPSGKSRIELQQALSRRRSVTWGGLRRSLQFGGQLYNEAIPTFCGPYVFTDYPQGVDVGILAGEADSDGAPWVVVSPSARIHTAPDPRSSVIGRVGHELIVPDTYKYWHQPDWEDSWASVIWHGRVAYMERKHLASPGDPHVCFKLQDGLWRISEFRDSGGRVQ